MMMTLAQHQRQGPRRAARRAVSDDPESAQSTAHNAAAERAVVPGRTLLQASGPPAGTISRVDAESGCRWLTEVPPKPRGRRRPAGPQACAAVALHCPNSLRGSRPALHGSTCRHASSHRLQGKWQRIRTTPWHAHRRSLKHAGQHQHQPEGHRCIRQQVPRWWRHGEDPKP